MSISIILHIRMYILSGTTYAGHGMCDILVAWTRYCLVFLGGFGGIFGRLVVLPMSRMDHAAMHWVEVMEFGWMFPLLLEMLLLVLLQRLVLVLNVVKMHACIHLNIARLCTFGHLSTLLLILFIAVMGYWACSHFEMAMRMDYWIKHPFVGKVVGLGGLHSSF